MESKSKIIAFVAIKVTQLSLYFISEAECVSLVVDYLPGEEIHEITKFKTKNLPILPNICMKTYIYLIS